MKFRGFFGAIIFLFLLTSTASGTEWEFVGKSTVGISYYVDVSTIRNNYGIISAWIKEHYENPRQTDSGKVTEAMYERETTIKSGSWHIGTGARYSESGDEIEKMTDFSSKPSTPGTIEETITSFLVDWCKRNRK